MCDQFFEAIPGQGTGLLIFLHDRGQIVSRASQAIVFKNHLCPGIRQAILGFYKIIEVKWNQHCNIHVNCFTWQETSTGQRGKITRWVAVHQRAGSASKPPNKTIDNAFYLASRRWLNNKSYQLTSLPLSEHPLSFQTPSETGERSWVRNPKYPKGRLQPLIQNDFCQMSGLQNHSIVQICTVPNQPSATNAAGRAVGDGAWRSPRKRGYHRIPKPIIEPVATATKILQNPPNHDFCPRAFF